MARNIYPIINHDYYINQLDSNIKDIQLGNPKYTIKTSGCYVCSIAMIICWYLGDSDSYTKLDIVKKLAKDCNANGDYKNDVFEYNGRKFRVNNKLSDMYDKLLEGYPSICQVGYHFAVINGYDSSKNGYNSYLVLDAGRRNNKTLKDVMDDRKSNIKGKRFVYEM